MQASTTESNSTEHINVTKDVVAKNIEAVKKYFSSGNVNNIQCGNILCTAASNDCADICELIIQHNQLNKSYIREAFCYAVRCGHLSTVQSLMKHMDKSDAASIALVESSTWGFTSLMQWLVEFFQLNEKDKTNWLLATACGRARRGDTKVVSEIISTAETKALDISEGMNKGLIKACFRGNLNVVDLLLSKGASANYADILFKDNNENMTALIAACFAANFDIAKKLLPRMNSFYINVQTNSGDIAVNSAKDNIGGNTALHMAVWGVKQRSQLQEACNKGGNIETCVLNCDINEQFVNGFTPIHYASRNGHREAVQILLAYGADVNVINDYGETPAMTAKRCGFNDMVELLKLRTNTRRQKFSSRQKILSKRIKKSQLNKSKSLISMRQNTFLSKSVKKSLKKYQSKSFVRRLKYYYKSESKHFIETSQ